MNQNKLKYRLRDKTGHPTDTWMPITAEVIRGKHKYDEVAKVTHAIAYNLRQSGLTWRDIGAVLNRSAPSVWEGAKKADKELIELVKSIEL